MSHNDLHIVVMAGGSGTRFWPLSRRARPKQVLDLSGDGTLLAGTFRRIESLAPPARWWMVVGAAHAEACRASVPEIPSAHVLVEPRGRNTAPAIALAALHISREDPDAVLAVLPADHYVADAAAFRHALERATELAQSGRIVTLGITPTRPETGFGYIEAGVAAAPGALLVARFREKPDRATAEELVASGRCYWNAGIFVMRASAYLAEVARQLPALGEAMQALGAAMDTEASGELAERLRRTYDGLEAISVDYGIMEGARNVMVVPVDCGWSDVGSFAALGAVRPPDAEGNVVIGKAVTVDCSNCVVYSSDDHVVGTVGLDGVVVVHTPDATLVVPADRAQDVRALVDAVGARGWSAFL